MSRAAALIPGQVAHIARDPLDPQFSDAACYAGLARRGTGIKRALIDQTLNNGELQEQPLDFVVAFYTPLRDAPWR